MIRMFCKFVGGLYLLFEFLGIFFTEAVIVYYLTDGAMTGKLGFILMILSSIVMTVSIVCVILMGE